MVTPSDKHAAKHRLPMFERRALKLAICELNDLPRNVLWRQYEIDTSGLDGTHGHIRMRR
jgi:hypothetical protein